MTMTKELRPSKRQTNSTTFKDFSDFKVFLNGDENARKELTGSKGKIFQRKEKVEKAND